MPQALHQRLTLWLREGLRALVALAFVIFLIRGDWESAFNSSLILLLMWVPGLLKRRYRLYLPLELDLAVTGFIFLTLFLGSLSDFYERFTWWDDLLHLLSGILLGTSGFILIYILNSEKVARLRLRPGFIAFFSICFSMAVSVVWEIYEFSMDSFLGFNMQRSGIPDTMDDFIVNAVGALFVAVIAYFWMRQQMRLPFTPKRLKKLE